MCKRVLATLLLIGVTAAPSDLLAQTTGTAGGHGPLTAMPAPPIFLQLPSALSRLVTQPAPVDVSPQLLDPQPIAGRPSRLSAAPRSSEEDIKKANRFLAQGSAVWYEHSGRTASGERFNPNHLTAAHRSLPFGSRVRVVNRANGKSVTVRINDRMGKAAARDKRLVIDLSRAAAARVGIQGRGTVALYLESRGAPIVASD